MCLWYVSVCQFWYAAHTSPQTNSMFLVHPTEGEVYRMGSHTAASSLTDLLTWRQKNKQVYIDRLVAYFSEHD